MHPLRLLWRKLLRDLNLRPADDRFFRLDAGLIQPLREIAARQQQPDEEVANELLFQAIAHRQRAEGVLALWKTLSRREQQAVALACLGHSPQEISRRMGISPETVKAHILHAVHKFGLHTKAELRQVLAEFDFSAWER